MGWIRCVGCVKLQRDFVAQTFALIAPVQYVLPKVSCSYEMIPNALKYYGTHWNNSLGSNGVDWVYRVSCSYETITNGPKHYETHQNMSLGSNGVDQVPSLRKIAMSLRGTNICINCTSSLCFAPTFMHLRNDPNCPQILRNTSKH